MTLLVHENIVWLKVSIDKIMLVNMLNCQNNFYDVLFSHFLSKFVTSLFFKYTRQITSVAVLKHYKQLGLGLEALNHFDNERVLGHFAVDQVFVPHKLYTLVLVDQ